MIREGRVKRKSKDCIREESVNGYSSSVPFPSLNGMERDQREKGLDPTITINPTIGNN